MNKTSPIETDLLIIGAGPAGLIAAITAAQHKRHPVILERMKQPGLKLLASGGGRCNITNNLPPHEFANAFGRHGRFIIPALKAFSSQDLVTFFTQHQLPIEFPDGQHGYPATQSAKDVLQILLKLCRQLQIPIFTETAATDLSIHENHIAAVQTNHGTIRCNTLLITTGGRGYPALGGHQSGYQLAQQAGHTIAPLHPANVPLITLETWPHNLAGLSLQSVRITCPLKGFPKQGWTGDLLFTHRGLSGPLILDISRHITAQLSPGQHVPLHLHITDINTGNWRQTHGKKQILNTLSTIIPRTLAEIFCHLAEVPPDIPCAKLPKIANQKLHQLLTQSPLTIIDTERFEKAMVTQGGVALKEINPTTLQSKIIGNLYFAGEILNLDAPCGGFNLQWAFSSGTLAGIEKQSRPHR